MVIVAAVDRSDRTQSVVERATNLAGAYNEPVHVVHALSRSEFIDLALTDYNGEETISMDEIKSFAANQAKEAAGELTIEHEYVGRVGEADTEILRYADDVDARYIVVGPRRRSPAGKVVFGSVAQSVLLNANCPVVAVINQDL